MSLTRGSLHVYVLSCLVGSDSLWSHGLQPARLLCPWDSPGKNTGVGCHAILQGIFPTQGSNPHLFCLLHWQVGFFPLAPPRRLTELLNYLQWEKRSPLLGEGILFGWDQNLGKEENGAVVGVVNRPTSPVIWLNLVILGWCVSHSGFLSI